jgi:hypothetical protein
MGESHTVYVLFTERYWDYQVMVIRWAGSRIAYNILVQKSMEDMRRSLHRREDNIKKITQKEGGKLWTGFE